MPGNDPQTTEPSVSPGHQVRIDDGVLHTVINGVAHSFRLRRPRASIEAEMGDLEHSAEAGTALMLEVLLDIRELLEERLPMASITVQSGTLPAAPWDGNTCASPTASPEGTVNNPTVVSSGAPWPGGHGRRVCACGRVLRQCRCPNGPGHRHEVTRTCRCNPQTHR